MKYGPRQASNDPDLDKWPEERRPRRVTAIVYLSSLCLLIMGPPVSLFHLVWLPVAPVALGHSIMERVQVVMDRLSETRTAVPYFAAGSLPLSSIFVSFFNCSQRLTTPTSGARFTRMTSVKDAIQECASTSHPALVFGRFVIMRPALAHFATTSEFIALRQPLIKTNGFKAPFYHVAH